MQIIEGMLSQAIQIPSPNCDERPEREISLVVIHCISLPAGHFGNDYVEKLFCNQITGNEHEDFCDLSNLKVSSHLFIRRSGEVIQFVPFHQRAWHAGVSEFRGRDHCNDFSVGIELEGVDCGEYSPHQYEILGQICSIMQSQWSLDQDVFVAHSDIAPNRKSDPGPGFDWARLFVNLSHPV
ncbi:MAG: AmpD protein [Candidatus Azotimanducaceae bacterium]|jgi:AmpD protein